LGNRIFILYIVASRRNGTLYVGVTGNPVGRIWQHREGAVEGFTSAYGVRRLVWYQAHDDPYEAIAHEKRLKSWKREWKIRLIEASNPDWRDLWFEIAG
jgi:putative endonuclease